MANLISKKKELSSNQINPLCNDCKLHLDAKTVCLRGKNGDIGYRPLVVFTDYPDYFADNAKRGYALDVGRMLDWLFARMSIELAEHVAYEYTLRCYAKNTLPTTKADRAVCIEECSHYRYDSIAKLQPKAIAVLGQVSLEAFTGKTGIGGYVERKVRAWEPVVSRFVREVHVGYSINYILTSPADTVGVFRVLFEAAKDAGLNPKLNPNVPPFSWRNLLF